MENNTNNNQEKLNKVLEMGPEAEVSYICDKDGATKVVIKGTGAAVMFGLLNILENVTKSSGKRFEEVMLDLLQMHPAFELVLRKKAEPTNRGNGQ